MDGDYLPRLVDPLLDELFGELSAVMLTGPRACGKTTTAARRAESVLHLDEPQQASAFRAAPDAVLAAQVPPVLLDEWQDVPDSMGAVKRAVDAGGAPGRYLLTGSVRARRSGGQWPGTGRVVPVSMYGLTVAEIERRQGAGDLLTRLFAPGDLQVTTLDNPPSLVDYLDLSVRGGFPDAIRLSDRARAAWYDGYVEQLVYRDAADLETVRSPERLMALLRAVALNTAGSPAEVDLAAAAGLDVRTVRSYLDLLEDLRVVERVPAWHSSRFTRLVKASKYYVIDAGLAAVLSGTDRAAILRSGDAVGRMIDTFVASQIRPLLSLGPSAVTMSHLRDRGGDHEIDLVLENRSGEVVALEVKSSGDVGARDARHLTWLRDKVGPAFLRGVVLHTGSTVFPLGERIIAVPIAAMWRGLSGTA